MSGRAGRLERLLAIRALNEELDRHTLEVALASMSEVEAALLRQEQALSESKLAARTALSDGNHSEWLLADAQIEVAGWNRQRLQTLLRPRAQAASEAMERLVESRREQEQVKQLVDDAARAARSKEDRRTQAAADDWFLSRRKRTVD
jgi:flagellar biosynthesis chaperone FliJ